jgi:starvation-inducible DNA-binding protein
LNDNTSINLPNSDLTDEEMMVDLVDSHETIVMNIRKAIGMAQKHHDYVTTDMLTSRLEYHEKVAWMMRSYFEK